MKAKFIRRNDNVDMTRSKMQSRINTLKRLVTEGQNALQRKNRKLGMINHFVNFLISQEKLKRQEVKDFFKPKIENGNTGNSPENGV